MNKRCDCGEWHPEQDIYRVHVVNPNPYHDWGEFDYCQESIDEDRKRGFIVKVKSPVPDSPQE